MHLHTNALCHWYAYRCVKRVRQCLCSNTLGQRNAHALAHVRTNMKYDLQLAPGLRIKRDFKRTLACVILELCTGLSKRITGQRRAARI